MNNQNFKKTKKLAEAGDAEAQLHLGFMYNKGIGVIEDNKEAVKWFTLAAEQGVANAQFNLGLMYDDGDGVAENKKEAEKWFNRAYVYSKRLP